MQKKGKLKIFFGYCAGVGKTYSMLENAHELKKQGVDVVVGYYEPHPRPETAKLLKGLEQIPNKKIKHKGITFNEFDIDAALKRKPSVILVDELAHTNVVGSRNEKRYLDVLELLDSGIDVYTTVNVQHLESVNDLIKENTDNNVRETVPDNIFNACDGVKLIDADPNEIIKRLKSGKIYPEKQIDISLQNFFNLKKLSYLRELSMRQSADKITLDQNNGYVSNDIVVLITPSPSSEKNIRAAARLAESKHTGFTALYVNKEYENINLDTINKHINLVKDLGGETTILYGEDIVNIIANYVKIHQTKTIVIGKSWSESLKKGIENKLISLLPNVEFSIIPYTKKHWAYANDRKKKIVLNLLSFDWISTIKMILCCAIILPIYYALNGNDFNVICIFFYFLIMLVVSYKNKNAIYVFITALVGSLGYIFLGQSFEGSEIDITLIKVVTCLIMFIMGLTYAWFIFTYSNQLKKINKSNKALDAMNLLTLNILKCKNESEKYKIIGETISILFSRSCYIYFGESRKENLLFNYKDENDSFFESTTEKAIMEWVKKNNRPAGKGTLTLNSSSARYEPIINKKEKTIVIGLSCKSEKLNYQDLTLFKNLLAIIQISI